jgi:hypothetical protein
VSLALVPSKEALQVSKKICYAYVALLTLGKAFALANTSGLTPILSWLAFNAVEIEAKINSVERNQRVRHLRTRST